MDDESISEFMELANNIFTDDEKRPPKPSVAQEVTASAKDLRREISGSGLSQYASINDGQCYIPANKTIKTLPPDCYQLSLTMEGTVMFIPQKIVTDSLLRLPDSKSDEVIAEVEKFWTLKDKFKKYGFAHKRGFLLWGPPGCHAKGTNVMMADGSSKLVEDVVVGDKLMGPDSEPRTVLELRRGTDKMVKVIPTKGKSFIVNQHHILHLEPSHENEIIQCPFNISVKDLLENTTIPFKDRFKLVKKELNFPEKELQIPPYIMGLWLGDGTRTSAQLTTMDKEIANEWIEYGKTLNLKTRIHKQQVNSKASSYTFSSSDGHYQKGSNQFLNKLRYYNLLGNKFVPKQYLYSSRKQRLELLAGIIDTDGSNGGTGTRSKFGTGYDYITKDKQLANDVVYLSRSLGFAAYIKECIKGCYVGKHKYFEGNYYKIYISGDLSVVPVRLERKKCKPRKSIKDVKRTGFKIEVLPEEGNYYGFTLDRDHLYLTDDFIVHHNSGKTSTIAIIMKEMANKNGLVFIGDNPLALNKALAQLRTIEPDRPVVVLMEDIDTIIQNFGENAVLSLLDGETQVENIVYIATTNYPEKLDGRIINRPSRFDRVVKIGLPNDAARAMYLESRINTTKKDGIDLVRETAGLSIAHLKELIVATFCQELPVEEVLKRLQKMKVTPKSDREDNKMGF